MTAIVKKYVIFPSELRQVSLLREYRPVEVATSGAMWVSRVDLFRQLYSPVIHLTQAALWMSTKLDLVNGGGNDQEVCHQSLRHILSDSVIEGLPYFWGIDQHESGVRTTWRQQRRDPRRSVS